MYYDAWCADCGIVIDCMLACVFCMFAVFPNDSDKRSELRGGNIARGTREGSIRGIPGGGRADCRFLEED